MPPAGLEPAIPASDQPQTLALNCSTTGISRFDPRTVQPVASRYTNYAIPAPTDESKQNFSQALCTRARCKTWADAIAGMSVEQA